MARLCYIGAMIMLSLASASACNDPFVLIKGNCFYFHGTYKTWSDAREYCMSLSTDEYTSDLAVVHSCTQLGAIKQHTILEYGSYMYWIGGYDIGEEGKWHWVNGDTVPRGNPYWYPNRPFLNNTMNCLSIEKYNGYFCDYLCEHATFFICEATELPLASLDLV